MDGRVAANLSTLIGKWYCRWHRTEATPHALHEHDESVHTDIMACNDWIVSDGVIEGSVWLRPYFRLRVNHTLTLESTILYLCADSSDNATCTYSQIWTIQVS